MSSLPFSAVRAAMVCLVLTGSVLMLSSVTQAYAQEEKKSALDRVFNRTDSAPAQNAGSIQLFVPQQDTGAVASSPARRPISKKSGLTVMEELELVKEINYANNEKAMAEIALEAMRKQEIFEAQMIKDLGYDPKDGHPPPGGVVKTSGKKKDEAPKSVIKYKTDGGKKATNSTPKQEEKKPSLFNRIQ